MEPDEARAFRWTTLVFVILTLAAGVAFVASGFALWLLLVGAALLVGSFFASMIWLMG